MKIEIEKPGRKMPDRQIARAKTPERYAMEALVDAEIGSSFFAPPRPDLRFGQSRLGNMAAAVAGKGWAIVRKEGDGWRVMKIAAPSR